jgi:hypothetical protein
MSDVSNVEKSVDKTVQPGNNGGTLRRGNPGNKGGSGRPPAEIRQRCADGFYRHISKAEQILNAKDASNADKIRALDVLGKYAGLQKIEHEHTKKVYREAIDEVRQGLRLVG